MCRDFTRDTISFIELVKIKSKRIKLCAKTIDISEDEAQNIIDAFFTVVPKVKHYLNHMGFYGKTHLVSHTMLPFGRKRYYDLHDMHDFKRLSEIERQSKNHGPQGTNGDIIKAALILINNHIKKHNLDIKIINSIYDEIITECREDLAEAWLPVMESLMIQAAGIVIKSIPIKVDIHITDKWEK